MTTIPAHYPVQFATNWRQKVQQIQSKLRALVTLDLVEGKEKSYNYLDEAVMREITSRAGETTAQDQTTEKRWNRTRGFDAVKRFDEFDEALLGAIVLPTSDVVASHAAAYNRKCDELICAAAVGTAYKGEDGTTPVVLPETQKVAVSYVETGSAANSGLTVAKLRHAMFILDDADADSDEERFFVAGPKQKEDLLRTTEITSRDYNAVQALVEGKIDVFMGFKFRWSKRAVLDSTTDIRTCFGYVKSGIVLSDSGHKVHMDILPTQNHCLQVRSVARLGAARNEEKKVVSVACDQSP
ncbi:MAG: phage capsid protein [Verrucomicrobiae bacterium]